jgi:hypothetical protein
MPKEKKFGKTNELNLSICFFVCCVCVFVCVVFLCFDALCETTLRLQTKVVFHELR